MPDVVKAGKAAQAEVVKAVAELDKYLKECKAKKSKYVKNASKHPNDMRRLHTDIVKTLQTWAPRVEDSEELMGFANGKIADMTRMNARYQKIIDQMVHGLKDALQKEAEEKLRQLMEALEELF
jgi:t-SNARE complex subunit (syntaxin)